MSSLTLDTFLSDPMLLVGALLFVVSPLVFAYSLVKYLSFKEPKPEFAIPEEEPVQESEPEPQPVPEPEPEPEKESEPVEQKTEEQTIPAEQTSPAIEPQSEIPPPPPAPDPVPEQKSEPEPPKAEPAPAPAPAVDAEKTVVISPQQAELQGQLDIALTQIKTLNDRILELEQHVELLQRHSNVNLEKNELKDAPPADPNGFTQKLLKLAQHVIVLEKEMTRLKAGGTKAPTTPTQKASPPDSPPQPKPSSEKPPMPL